MNELYNFHTLMTVIQNYLTVLMKNIIYKLSAFNDMNTEWIKINMLHEFFQQLSSKKTIFCMKVFVEPSVLTVHYISYCKSKTGQRGCGMVFRPTCQVSAIYKRNASVHFNVSIKHSSEIDS